MKKNLLILLAVLFSFSFVLIVACGDDVADVVGDDDDTSDRNGVNDDDVSDGSLGTSCFSDSECAAGLVCMGGMCSNDDGNTDDDDADDDDNNDDTDDDDNNDDTDDDDTADCEVDSQCDPGFICDNGACVEDPGGCSSDGDCAITPNTPKCDPATRQCVQCLGDADCGGGYHSK